MITAYTREAGVRSLERKIGTICRKSARKILEEKESCVRVEKENLEEFLGRARYTFQKKNEEDQIGIVRGLAWTSVGGDTLQIEVNLMPGQGEFVLTGQMGDVMKESAQIGISYIRSIAENYQIDAEFFKNNDIHIHIPGRSGSKGWSISRNYHGDSNAFCNYKNSGKSKSCNDR